jgi:hypothetical protein
MTNQIDTEKPRMGFNEQAMYWAFAAEALSLLAFQQNPNSFAEINQAFILVSLIELGYFASLSFADLMHSPRRRRRSDKY